MARIEEGQWGGKPHLGRFEARVVLMEVCSVVFFFSLGQDGKLFLWLVFDEAGSRLVVFFVCAALFLFFPFIFF